MPHLLEDKKLSRQFLDLLVSARSKPGDNEQEKKEWGNSGSARHLGLHSLDGHLGLKPAGLLRRGGLQLHDHLGVRRPCASSDRFQEVLQAHPHRVGTDQDVRLT